MLCSLALGVRRLLTSNSNHMLRRAFGMVVIVATCSATSCVGLWAVALSPTPGTGTGLIASTAFPLVERVVTRRQLHTTAPEDRRDSSMRCFARETLIACGRTTSGRVEFYFRQDQGFKPWADSVRQEVVDSLRNAFGAAAVQECPRTVECPLPKRSPE